MTVQSQDCGGSRDCGPKRIIASALGGILTSLVMTPLDVVKIRMQAKRELQVLSGSPFYYSKNRRHAVSLEWFVTNATVIYYSLNDWLKYRINLCYTSNECQTYQSTMFVSIVPPIVGVISRVFSVFTISPLELMRTKLQSKPMTIQSFYETARSTVIQGGIQSLWIGVGATLLRDVPFSAIFWYVYDYNKNKYRQTRMSGPANEEALAALEFPMAFFYGAIAGFAAGVITHPFDVIKTHRQLELGEALFGQKTYSNSTWKALRQLYRQKGVVALFSGFTPRLLKTTTASALMVSVFEVNLVKRHLKINWVELKVIWGRLAVHAGAGFHSPSKECLYEDVCMNACAAAAHILNDSTTEFAAINAATAAISVLEDSPLTNAGFGSCLNFDGHVECDAGLMCGKSLLFTSVGSVSCIKNPIQIPKHLILQHLTEPASPIGRVKPLSLCGDGARRWASEAAGIPILPDHCLISHVAKRRWQKYRGLVDEHSCSVSSFSTDGRPQPKKPRCGELDTVGAVCLDGSGNICAASSSGGIPLKLGGRLGQACVYGCGSWAEVTPTVSVGCVTSGTGEQLIKTQLAQRVASKILNRRDASLPSIVNAAFQEDFLDSRFLSNETTEKLGSVVGMPKRSLSDERADPSESDDTVSSTDKSRKSYSSRGSIYYTIYNRLKKLNKDDGTLLVYALRLPNKRSHPEYYDKITSPIDPDKILAKVKGGKYETIEEMAEDVKLLVANTHSFFGATSQEGRDASAFEDAFNKEAQSAQNLSSKAPSVASTSSSVTIRSFRRGMKQERIDDEETDVDAASVAASEISEASTAASHRTAVSKRALEAFFASIVSYDLEGGRHIAQTFATLPQKQMYPQYYEVITNPIDLRMIAQRILNGTYHTFGEVERDFVQMGRNAKHFNEPKSKIYQDAVTLLRIIKEKKIVIKKRFKADPYEESTESNAHAITEDYANLPEAVDVTSPVPKVEDDDEVEDYEADEDGEDGSAAAISTPIGFTVVKRRRGRPRKHPLDSVSATPASPTPSEGSADRRSTSSTTTTTITTPVAGGSGSGIGGVASSGSGGGGGNSAMVDISFLMLDESIAPPGSPPHMAPIVDPSVSSEEQLIPTMLSTAAVGSLRWWGEHVLEAICTATNSMGTLLALPFMRLPSRKMYPDYFRRIPNPICLAKIRRKIKRNEYHSLADVRGDIDRVFMNAQAYNMEGSDIYNVAVYLQQLTKSKFVELSQIAAKAENAGLVSPSAKRRQSRPPGESEEVTPPKRRHPMTAEEARNKRLINLYNAVYNHIDDDGHRPRDTFMILPSKEDYPDYYEVIQEPIDLTMIKERMDSNKYPTHQAMVADLRLMFNNARRYNEEDSQVYRDADTLDRVVKKRLKSLGPYASCPQGMPRSPGIRPPQDLTSPYGGLAAISQHSGSVTSPLQRLMYEVFQAVREYRDPMGRQLSTPFLRLPSKAELPTYYEFIKRPIEMQEIAKFLLQGGYTEFEEFMSDMFLMFDNACAFNEPDSQIYRDTLVLHQVALAKRNMLLSAAFSSGTVIPGMSPSSAPDILPGVRRLLTSLHNAMLTACDTDGRGLVDSLIAGDGTETSVTSATAARLAALHRSVAAGAYKRLDRLQADWLEVLRRARVGEGEECMAALSEIDAKSNLPTPQQRQDAAELARRWIRLRDSMCRRAPSGGNLNAQLMVTGESSGSESGSSGAPGMSLPTGWHIVSTAMGYTEAVLERDLKDEAAQHEPMVFSDDGEENLPPLEEGESELQSVDSKGQTFHLGDYVYIEPLRQDVTQYHIGRITRISEIIVNPKEGMEGCNKSAEVTGVKVRCAMYMRPSEAKPSRRRRLLAAEVFRTATAEVVPPSKLSGHCLVMHIPHFIRSRPKNIEERDVYVCESQYSINSNLFAKIRRWGVPTPSGIELEDRQLPFVPTRLPPSEPLESALEQVNTNSFSCMAFPLPGTPQTVVDEVSKTEGIITYEQYAGDNNFAIKQGDCVFVPSSGTSTDRQILRIDKIWKNINEEAVSVTGSIFVFPTEVEHLPTRVFYPREVFLTNNDRATFSITSIKGKCFVMRPADFCIARPTSYREGDIFVCESKYFEDEKVIRKLKKGLKKHRFSSDTVADEYFLFSQPIVPHKEASPLLVKASPSPLILDQLNQPPSMAVACVVAAANGQTTPVTDFGPRLAPAPPQSPDVGQLAFMEVGLDRSGKKRKLRKPPSGYVIYAGEIRKKLLQDRPDAPFGEISREVGLMWRQMPSHERDIYERKAQVIKRRMEEQETQQKARMQEQEKFMQVHHHELVSHGDPHNVAIGTGMPTTISQAPAQLQTPGTAQPNVQSNSLSVSAPHHAAAAAMQFYQATPGAPGAPSVIQLMHTTTTPSTVASGPASMQPRPGMIESPLVAGATVLTNAMSHTPVLATTGGQQVVYQFAGQQAPGLAAPTASPNVSLAGPQVILTHPHHPQITGQHSHHQHQATSSQPFAVLPTQPPPQARQHAIPPQQVQVVQQLSSTTVEGNHATVVNGGSGTGCTPTATITAPPRAPSPLFVSVPPRTSRVLHSEIYQRYIDRLRRNTPCLSEWKKQISVTMESLPPMAHQQQQQLASSFLDTPQLHSHHGTIVDALWSLRDNLLKDSLNIRTRILGLEEL
ncbi:Protein polybromo-1 [Taenia crassiceps]|uniref:Protein polybromo-1 n=1 Tax=Taenia crassiceps TaxID=6207 RepID=A0ABR4QSD0_9CEST